MTTRVVGEQEVLGEARRAIEQASSRVWIASAWVRDAALVNLLRDLAPRLSGRGVDLRLVYRLKEPSDFVVSQFEELDRLAVDHGMAVRFSRRLHAKLIVVDDQSVLVGSSNLTPTAGYARLGGEWQNEELNVVIEADAQAVEEAAARFLQIWDQARSITSGTLGIAMDAPTTFSYSFAAVAEVPVGSYVSCADPAGRAVLGIVGEVVAYNPSFPLLGPEQAVLGAGTQPLPAQRLPSLRELFAQPNKERAFQYASTFHEPESLFCVASVKVLKREDAPGSQRLVSPTGPVAPGGTVTLASPPLLDSLVGTGDLALGRLLRHHEVPVRVSGQQICSRHLAVLGQTGSGKSNALKVLVRELAGHPDYADRRLVVFDPHGEYRWAFAGRAWQVRVVLRTWVRDEELLRRFGLRSGTKPSSRAEWAWSEALVKGEGVGGLARRLHEGARELKEPPTSGLDGLAAALEREPERYCLRAAEVASLVQDDNAAAVDFDPPGLYVVDLTGLDSTGDRGTAVAEVANRLFEQAKAAHGGPEPRPALLVFEEAHSLIPEDGYASIPGLRASREAAIRVASEGRKFNVGLVLSSQRAARVAKDALSQCNSQILMRVVSKEDLDAVAGSFEAASGELLAMLPSLDTGVGLVGGTAVAAPVAVQLPEFEPGAPAGGCGEAVCGQGRHPGACQEEAAWTTLR